MSTADPGRTPEAAEVTRGLKITLVFLVAATIIGATLSAALVVVARHANETADLANHTAQRVDRNTRKLERATMRIDRLREGPVRSGFLSNCRAIRQLAKDHVHLGQGRELAQLPCEKLARQFLVVASRR